jgi:hypothetical protein
MTGDVTDQIEDCEEIYLAQCRLVRRKLENGVYQKEDQMEQAFAMAYTAALYDRVGKLPDKPSNNPEPFEPREFTEAYMTSWEKHPRHRDQIMTMIMHPEMATKMLNDTEGLKRYVDKSDAKVRAWRMKEDEKVRIRNEKRAKASKQLEERRRLKNPGKT